MPDASVVATAPAVSDGDGDARVPVSVRGVAGITVGREDARCKVRDLGREVRALRRADAILRRCGCVLCAVDADC